MRGENDRSQKLAARPDERAGRSFAHLSHALLPNASHGERIFSASATESASASFKTSDGTHFGKSFRLD